MKDFSFVTRAENLERFKNEQFDLLIIGGGITGAGVARDASARGLKVALIEAHDFSYGTSSRSSKLVHGGIRYLENLEFNLVFEALNERTKLFEIAPHLVHPLRFMIPLYTDSRVGMFKMGLGMWLYDALALFQSPEMHEKLNKIETLDRNPIVKGQDLVGSFIYSDAYMDDDRLVHETLRSANENNAVMANYVKASRAHFNKETQKIESIEVIDQQSNEKFNIKTKQVVCNVGPWTDLVGEKLFPDWKKILRPTKGIHLTFLKSRVPLETAVVMAAQDSKRIVFAIPRHEMVIVGTTDTDYKGDPSLAKVESEDVQYLLKVTNDYFPGAKLTEADIVSSYVGVRPLVKDESDNEGKTSREHTIIENERGFIVVAGGKYTTYRLMAEQIVDKVIENTSFEQRSQLKKCTTNTPLNEYVTVDAYHEAQLTALDDVQKQLAFRYGAEYKNILDRFGVTENLWTIEALQAIHHTMCLNLVDFYVRRVPLFLSEKDHGLKYINDISQVFQENLGWTNEQTQDEIKNLVKYINDEKSWAKNKH